MCAISQAALYVVLRHWDVWARHADKPGKVRSVKSAPTPSPSFLPWSNRSS